MDLIIHAGLPKTGSTSLQNSLVKNSNLLEKNNYFYPIIDKKESSHHLIVFSFKSNTLTDTNQKQIHEYLSSINVEKLILSSELFLYLLPEQLEHFKKILSFDNLRIIFYQRNLMDFIISSWNQSIRFGNTETFSDFFKNLCLPVNSLKLSSSIDFHTMYTRWAECFGKESIEIYDYDQIDDVVDHFFKEILHIDNFTQSEKINVSEDMFNIEFKRVINETRLTSPFFDAKFFSNENPFYEELLELKKEFLLKAEPYVINHELRSNSKLLGSMEKKILTNWKSNIKNYTNDYDPLKKKTRHCQYISPEFIKSNKNLKNKIEICIKNTYNQLSEEDKKQIDTFHSEYSFRNLEFNFR